MFYVIDESTRNYGWYPEELKYELETCGELYDLGLKTFRCNKLDNGGGLYGCGDSDLALKIETIIERILGRRGIFTFKKELKIENNPKIQSS